MTYWPRDRAITSIAAQHGLVLLYHGAFTRAPEDIERGLHNLAPDAIAQQVDYLGRFFEFIGVDEFAALSDPAGFAAVSFDDGYACVFDEARPLLERRKIPFTVFLNGANFQGGRFWRDKVRLLESRGWVEEFEARNRDLERTGGRRFYRYTKSRRNDSRIVTRALDRFLAEKSATNELNQYCVEEIRELPLHPLIRYGNHSQHHYVMSSLDTAGQAEEIGATELLLDELPETNRSRLFSIPFGDIHDFNAGTVRALRHYGYTRALLSRNRLAVRGIRQAHGIDVIERFMPRTETPDGGLVDHFAPT